MDPGQVANEIRKVFERCQRRYPTIQLPFDQFLGRVEEILSGLQGTSQDDANAHGYCLMLFFQLHHEDLFLAMSCSQGDRIAWEYFVDDYLPILRSFSKEACRFLHEPEEEAVEITSSFSDDRRKLGEYDGRSTLGCWLRVACSHAAVMRYQKSKKGAVLAGQSASTACLQSAESKHDNEAKGSEPHAQYGPVLSRMLADEIGGLQPRDRLLLNLHCLEGISNNTISRQFHVQEATVSRWLAGLQKDIRKRIERELRNRHGLHSREIQSLWDWLSKQEVLSASPPTDEHLMNPEGESS
jgi:RNA polymerase sigma-70 factor